MKRDPKFEVRCSKFRKSRTSDLEPRSSGLSRQSRVATARFRDKLSKIMGVSMWKSASYCRISAVTGAILSRATLSLMPEPQASDLFPRCDGGRDGLSCRCACERE